MSQENPLSSWNHSSQHHMAMTGAEVWTVTDDWSNEQFIKEPNVKSSAPTQRRKIQQSVEGAPVCSPTPKQILVMISSLELVIVNASYTQLQ